MSDAIGAAEAWPAFDLTDGDYTKLAAYITPDATWDVLAPGPDRPEYPAPVGRERKHRVGIAHDLLRLMVEAGFVYDDPLLSTIDAQRIRHVFAARRSLATCLDLALIYAGLCEREHLYAVPVLIHESDRRGHALVAVILDRGNQETERAVLAAGSDGPSQGMWQGTMTGPFDGFVPDLLRQRNVLLVDPTEATRVVHGVAQDEIERLAFNPDRWTRRHTQVTLVDAPWLRLHRGVTPYHPSRSSPIGLTTQIARATETFHDYPSRAGLADELAGSTGLLVVQGRSGSGKSTLGLEAAARFDRGFGWVLRADDERSILASLARAYASEEGESDALGLSGDAADRKDAASFALARLSAMAAPWVVVADNADDGDAAREIYDALPSPGPNQLVLVTTTSTAWRSIVDDAVSRGEVARYVAIAPLGEPELADAYPELSPAAQAIAGGLPLLAEALRTFEATAGPIDPNDAPDEPANDGTVLAEATALWRAVRGHVDIAERATLERGALVAALMPPGHVDLQVVDQLAGTGVAPRLVELGIIDAAPEPGVGLLHRAFGAAIRRSADQASYDRCLVDVWADRSYLSTVDEYGSAREVLDRQAELVDAAGRCAPDPNVGRALAGQARLLELFGKTVESRSQYTHALDHLSEDRSPDLRYIAEARHGIHRATNHAKTSTRADFDDARQAMADVVALRQRHAEWIATSGADGGDIAEAEAEAEVEASRALMWLLTAKVAEIDGDREQSHRALDELELSAKRREEILRAEHPLTLRGTYNVAAQAVRLGNLVASDDPAQATAYFDRAIDTYERVEQGRRAYHRRQDHIHVASCVHGTAIATYNKAVYGAVPDRSAAFELLDEAHGRAMRARDMRLRVPRTTTSLGDLGKSWHLLYKISRAQHCLRDPDFARTERERLWHQRDDAPAKAPVGDDREVALLLDRFATSEPGAVT